MEKVIEKIEVLNEYEKIFLVYKIFDIWFKGKIQNNNKSFLPKKVKIYNEEEILKVFFTCSKIKKSKKINSIIINFENLEFVKKLDFIIFLFKEINHIKSVPTYIKDNFNFLDLSNEILKYKSKNV